MGIVECLKTVQDSLRRGDFESEAAVTQGAVMRVLSALVGGMPLTHRSSFLSILWKEDESTSLCVAVRASPSYSLK